MFKPECGTALGWNQKWVSWSPDSGKFSIGIAPFASISDANASQNTRGAPALNYESPDAFHSSPETPGFSDFSLTRRTDSDSPTSLSRAFEEEGGNLSSSRSHNFWETVLGSSEEKEKPKPGTFPKGSWLARRFACSSCPARFKRRCNLETHVQNVHEKIRPFSCSVCYRRFARKSNCVKHVSIFICASLATYW